jgi:hypothetical protein
MDREVNLHPDKFSQVFKIAFFIPKGEYMTIDEFNPYFCEVIELCQEAARRTVRDKAEEQAAIRKEERRQLYLELKKEFE